MRLGKSASLAMALALLLLASASLSAQQNTGSRNISYSAPAASYYNGEVFEGTYIRVGFNDYGVLGVHDPSLGDVGFQYPIGSDYESLAAGWWGDGWSVFYDTSSAGFSPDDDAWGTISGATPVTEYVAIPGGVRKTSIIETTDDALRIQITMYAWNSEKYVVAEINITNIGTTTLSNVEFKKIVDWDVWETYTDFDNYWGMDDLRAPNLHMAVAFANTTIAPGTVYMGLAARPGPDAVDLNWDDYTLRGMSGAYVTYIRLDGTTDAYFDGAAVYDWLLGDLDPGESVVIRVAYVAGDTLDELEANAAAALGVPPVGGRLVSGSAGLHAPWLIALAAALALAAVISVARLRRLS